MRPIVVAIPYRTRQEEAEELARQFADQGAEAVYLIANAPRQHRRIDEQVVLDKLGIRDHKMHDANIHEMWNWSWGEARDTVTRGALLLANDDIEIPPRLLEWLRIGLEYKDTWVISPDPMMKRPFAPAWETQTFQRRAVETRGVGAPRPYLPNGGVCGWCFAVRTDVPMSPLVNPDLSWYYGEDWIVRETWRLGGKAAYMAGIGVGHLLSATLKTRLPELQAAIDRDHAVWRELTKGDK